MHRWSVPHHPAGGINRRDFMKVSAGAGLLALSPSLSSAAPAKSATKQYKDEHGYAYVETSDWWKTECIALPCFSALWWPDYTTKVIEHRIDGKPVVIQLWLGWCQKFLAMDDFPGGIGAEVGIYRRIPGKRIPSTAGFAPSKLADHLLNGAKGLAEEKLWWAYPELGTEVSFELINPVTKKTFFRAGPEKTYWMNKWMNPSSYEKYKKDQGGPTFSANYQMKYTINGSHFEWTA